MENSKTAKLEYNLQAKAAAQAGPIPKGIPYITPALGEVFHEPSVRCVLCGAKAW